MNVSRITVSEWPPIQCCKRSSWPETFTYCIFSGI